MKINSKIKSVTALVIIAVILTACKVKLADNIIPPSPTPTGSPVPRPSASVQVTAPVNNGPEQLEFRKILNGENSNIRSYDVRVIENEADFQKLWDDHTGSKTNPLFLPVVDFSKKNVLAVFLGERPTTGYSVNIDKIIERPENISVFIIESKPKSGEQVLAKISQPFLIIETQKSPKKVVFENTSPAKPVEENVPFISLEEGIDSGIKTFSRRIAKSEKEFSDLYREHLSNQKLISAPVFPVINFSREMVAGIFLGERPSNGYSINIENVKKTETQIIIQATEVPPPAGTTVNPIVTTPYIMVKLPLLNLPVNFDIKLIVPSTGVPVSQDNAGPVQTKSLSVRPLVTGDDTLIKTPQYSLITSREEFLEIWRRHAGESANTPPAIDFSANDVIGIFIGRRPTSGYLIEIPSVIESETEVRIFLELRKSETGIRNQETYPFNFSLIPKTGKAPSFIFNNLVKD